MRQARLAHELVGPCSRTAATASARWDWYWKRYTQLIIKGDNTTFMTQDLLGECRDDDKDSSDDHGKCHVKVEQDDRQCHG